MVNTLEQLKKEATEAAEFRGHRILWFDTITRRGMIASGTCGCGEWVQVTTNPRSDEVDIGGTAVALNCGLAQVANLTVFNLVRGESRTVNISELYKELAESYSQQVKT